MNNDEKKGFLKAFIAILFFSILNVIIYYDAPANDLFSSYVASKLILNGNEDKLYIRDQAVYAVPADIEWKRIAVLNHYKESMNPYVQVPVWAYFLTFITRFLDFKTFSLLFLFLNPFLFFLAIFLFSKVFQLLFEKPRYLFILYMLLMMSMPYQNGMSMVQTHFMFLSLAIFSIYLSLKNREVVAGFLLSLASIVKITPALLLIYFIMNKRYKLVLSFMVCMTVLCVVSVVSVGMDVNKEFLDGLKNISNRLLVAYNNQSFVSAISSWKYPVSEQYKMTMFPIEPVYKWLSYSIMSTLIIFFSYCARIKKENAGIAISAILTVLTMFAPLAWNYYYIVLIFPVMIIINQAVKQSSSVYMMIVLAVFCLNIPPLSFHQDQPFSSITIIRSQFYSGLLVLFALLSMMFSRKEKLILK